MSDYGEISSNDEEYTEKSKTSSKQASNTSTRRDDGQGSWFSKNDSSKIIKKSPIIIEQRETKLKKVESSKLIWAKCNFFKGGPFCPARIAEVGEATCQKDIPTSIPPEFELVEFFCLPLKSPVIPRFVVCSKKDIVAFDSTLNGRKQLTMRHSYARNSVMDVDELNWDAGRMDVLLQVKLFFTRKSWCQASIDKSHVQNIRLLELRRLNSYPCHLLTSSQKLKIRYDVESSNRIITKIKRMAKEFLR